MATTKQDLVDGLNCVLREGSRVMGGFGPDDWKKKVLDEGGTWTRKQAYAHLTSTAEIMPGFLGGVSNIPEGTDAAAGLDIDALNAQLVAAKEQMGEADLQQAYQAGWTKLIDFVKAMPDDQLARPAKFRELNGEVGDILASILVLHGMAHIYGAGGSPLG